MACCAQKDFYEASQLHLFRSASIKLAEALAARADRPRKPETRQNEQSWRDKQQKNCRKKRNGKKKKHVLLRQTSERAAAGGISVRGASLNFCQLNSFQMHQFPAWPHPVQMPSLPAEPPQIGHVGANRGVPIFLKGNFYS